LGSKANKDQITWNHNRGNELSGKLFIDCDDDSDQQSYLLFHCVNREIGLNTLGNCMNVKGSSSCKLSFEFYCLGAIYRLLVRFVKES